ncbi:MAG: Ni/Fe hydrogenase subunit alpha [Candidatus Brocadiae bacterium]|nr:Ni/Fe hydrogenase subunit alpha [Candidatus Brocadiia bacterium]
MPDPGNRRIRVEALARVEGEGAMHIEVRGGKVEEVRLEIYEPPRFFEAFLRGRAFGEAPDITARICGICPIAYQMSAVHAMEDALGVRVGGALRDLRRLLYCGEWIGSHVLHIYMLHAPDFLGYEDAIRMAKDFPGIVERGLMMKKLGNEIVTTIGGREIHPVNVKVGGFYRTPARSELRALAEKLKRGRDAAVETVRWVAGFEFPDFEPDYEFVSLRHPNEYPFNEGRIASSRGLDADVHDYRDHFVEEHVRHSNALHSVIRGRGAYFLGPQARYSLNFDRLPAIAREAAKNAGLGPVCRNPFRSIIVRSVEVLFAFDEAIRIIEGYEPPPAPAVEIVPRAGEGCAMTEAPRGSLYHRYRIDADGRILEASIIPPTSQNQKSVEADLRAFAGQSLHLDDEALTWKCEQAIRNYDPCISCATHFLKLTVHRE